MNAAPLLKRLVEMAGPSASGGYVLALAEGAIGEIPALVEAGGVKYAVQQPETELALRRSIWKAQGAPFIALIPRPLAERLPPDILERSSSGHVHALEIADVLTVALGAQVSGIDDPELLQLALDRVELLRERIGHRTLPTSVDALLLEELLVEIQLGQRLRGLSAAAVFVNLLEQAEALDAPMRRLLRRQLPIQLGTEGRLLAWTLAEPGRLRALLVHGILLANPIEELPNSVWGPLDAAKGDHQQVGLTSDSLRRAVTSLVVEALDKLGGKAAPYLQEAETLARHLLPQSALSQSELLPLGFENRAQEIAKAAAKGQAIPRSEIQWLKAHRAVAHFRHEMALLEEMARLSRYLAEPTGPREGKIAAQARAYRRDGAFADLCAARLEMGLAATGRFHPEARALLDAWRKRRDADNLAFAKRLAQDYALAIGSEGIVTMPHILQDELRPRIDVAQQPCFLLVLDGCSYPVFLDLLWQLSQDEGGAIGLEVGENLRVEEGSTGLSILPSITSHARGALMAGQIPKDPLVEDSIWQVEAAKTDPARLKNNMGLGSNSRRLFLKGDLADGGAALRETLADRDIALVVAVFNAVDDLIGGSATGIPLQVHAKQIAGFLPALRSAFAAGRSVLVTADHGHSLFAGTQHRVGPGSTARFTELPAGAEVPDGFIEIDTAGMGGSEGRQAFAWRMSAYLGNQPKVGYHGGCSLEEMVVPLAWLTEGGAPADEPSWWFGAGGGVEPDAVSPQLADNAAAKLPVILPVPAPRLGYDPPSAPPTSVDSAATPQSGQSRVASATPIPDDSNLGITLDADERKALQLLARNHSVSMTELASVLGMRPGRVNGFMRNLQLRLEAEGQELFRSERLPSGETQFRFIAPSRDDRT